MTDSFGFKGRHTVSLKTGGSFYCLVCSGAEFSTRRIKLNTGYMTLFTLDWANVSSIGLACLKCGHLTEFTDGSITLSG